MSDAERMEGSSALNASGTARGEDTGDRLERAGLDANWPRNGQAVGEQLVLSAVTEELFLTAGDALAATDAAQGRTGDCARVILVRALAQGMAARIRGS